MRGLISPILVAQIKSRLKSVFDLDKSAKKFEYVENSKHFN